MSSLLQQKIESIFGLERVGERFNLDLMLEVLEVLDNPHLAYKTIQITGTNGKGSTAKCIHDLLKKNYRIAVYSSPHLLRYNERFMINDMYITDEELETIIDTISAILKEKNLQATFFEVTTLIAFRWFATQHIDYAVIEMGVGHPLDSTNVITPVASLITNIGLDHQELLGKTRQDIARNKMTCIKPGCLFLTAEQDAELLELFKQQCKLQKADYCTLNQYEHIFRNGTLFFEDAKIPVRAKYQLENFFLALQTVKELGLEYKLDEIQPPRGRFEIISHDPMIILDCAHNAEGFEKLQQEFSNIDLKKSTLITSLSKEYKIQDLKPYAAQFGQVLCVGESPMVQSAQTVATGLNGESCLVKDALSKSKGETIIIFGSIYGLAKFLQ